MSEHEFIYPNLENIRKLQDRIAELEREALEESILNSGMDKRVDDLEKELAEWRDSLTILR